MPQMTGLALAVRARRAGMELHIIITSGRAWLTNHGVYAWLRLSPSLEKPFTPDELLQSVEAVLHRSAKNQVALPQVECAVSDNASATQQCQGLTSASLVTTSK